MTISTTRVFRQAAGSAAWLLCAFASLGACAFAGEIVTLSSGARIAVDWHESVGSLVRLHQGDGSTDIPAQLIVGYEAHMVPVAPPPAEAPHLAAAPAVRPLVAQPAVVQPAVVVAPAPAPHPLDPKELLRDAAIRSGLPPEFVTSVAKVESGFRPDAVSPKGAIGVMQLMPDTAKALGADPHDLQQNIEAGTRLLHDLLVKYDGDVVKTLAAYNAGEKAVEKYRGLPPYDETRFYVNRVIGAYQQAGGR